MNAALKKTKQQPNSAKPVAWAPAFCNICSKTIVESKQALRIKHLDYSNGKTTSYSWAHRGCWR